MRNDTETIAPESSIVKLSTFKTPGGCGIELGGGSAVGAILLNEPDVSLHMWDIKRGTEFPWHEHNEMEVIIVVSGCVDIVLDRRGRGEVEPPGAKFRLEDKGVLTIPAGTAHSAVFSKDTALVSVHIPRSSDYAKWNRDE